MSGSSLIANHINVPYGRIVTAEDVELSLKAGCFEAHSNEALGLLAALFIECERSLIERAGRELNVPSEKLDELYQDSLRLGFHPIPEWEKSR